MGSRRIPESSEDSSPPRTHCGSDRPGRSRRRAAELRWAWQGIAGRGQAVVDQRHLRRVAREPRDEARHQAPDSWPVSSRRETRTVPQGSSRASRPPRPGGPAGPAGPQGSAGAPGAKGATGAAGAIGPPVPPARAVRRERVEQREPAEQPERAEPPVREVLPADEAQQELEAQPAYGVRPAHGARQASAAQLVLAALPAPRSDRRAGSDGSQRCNRGRGRQAQGVRQAPAARRGRPVCAARPVRVGNGSQW